MGEVLIQVADVRNAGGGERKGATPRKIDTKAENLLD